MVWTQSLRTSDVSDKRASSIRRLVAFQGEEQQYKMQETIIIIITKLYWLF